MKYLKKKMTLEMFIEAFNAIIPVAPELLNILISVLPE